MKDVQDAVMAARTIDGRLVRRPLSPHAGIYRWPITMVASLPDHCRGPLRRQPADGMVAGGRGGRVGFVCRACNDWLPRPSGCCFCSGGLHRASITPSLGCAT